MHLTIILGYKTLNQKYVVTSARVDYAACSLYAGQSPRVEGVPTNNQSGRYQSLVSSEGDSRQKVPTVLLVRVQCSKKRSRNIAP